MSSSPSHRLWCAALIWTLVLSGCAADGSRPERPAPKARQIDDTLAIRKQLLGTWLYEYNGVTIEVTYTDTTVTLPGVDAAPYALSGNEITVDIMGPKTSIIEFPNKDEMVQTNKGGALRYVFKRKPGG